MLNVSVGSVGGRGLSRLVAGLCGLCVLVSGLALVGQAQVSPSSTSEVGRAVTVGNAGTKAATLTDAEMARLVTALEDRIRQLEERIAMMSAVPAAAALAGAAAPAAAAAPVAAVIEKLEKEVTVLQEEAKQTNQFIKFLKDVEVTGIVDGYYSFNNNQVDMFTQGRAFDVRHNSFSLQMARIGLNKAATTDSRLGFRLDVGLGETVDRIISVSDYQRNEATKHLLQAYVSYVAPIGKGLTIDFGKMYTPIGAEVIDTKDNFNYSRGFLFTYGPYYHMGLRAKYAVNDKVAVTGFLFDGWDNMFENNRNKVAGKTAGVQLSLTPTKRLALTQTYLGGPEAPLANVPAVSNRDNWRHIADTVVSYVATDKFTLLGNFVAGSDGDNDGRRGTWKGISAGFKYAFNNRFAFAPRFEVLDDTAGLRTGTAQSLKGLTLTQEVKLVNNLLTRFEFRRDLSDKPFFANADGGALKNQNTFIIGISYSISSREQ